MQNRRAEALAILFQRYYRLVFDVAQRILRDRTEAEDLMQDVFIEVYEKAGLYDPARGSVKVWLLQYAYTRSFNRRKYLALRSFYDASPTAALAHLELAAGRTGREDLRMTEWQELLQKGIQQLNARERELVELVAYEGLTVRQASSRVHDTYVNCRNHYYRALKKLRQVLGRANSGGRKVDNVRS